MKNTVALKGIRSFGVGADDAALALLSAAIAVGLAASNLLHRADFFLNDDFRNYAIPVYGEISRLIRNGEMPFVTDRLWYSGAFLGEYQHGILNPICLALIALVGAMGNFAAAAATYALAHIAIFSLGTFFFCRVLGCPPKQALLAAIVAPTSEWIIYWGASNWISFLVSIAWLPWAWAAIIKSIGNSRWCVPGAAFVFLMITAGNPFTNLAFAISVLAVVFSNWKDVTSFRGMSGPFASIVGGGLLSLPALAPLVAYIQMSGRVLEIPHLQADLVALLGVGVPFMLTRWRAFSDSFEIVYLPMIGISWYILPALLNAPWRSLWARPIPRTLACATLVLGLMAVMPALWQFRWMFRLLPYYQFGLVALSALALSEGRGDLERWNGKVTAACTAIPIWISLWQAPLFAPLYILLGLTVLAIVFIAWRQRQVGREGFTAIALAGHAILFVTVGFVYSKFPDRFPNDWRPPTRLIAGSEPPLTRYEIFDLPPARSNPPDRFWLYYRPGNTGLERPGVSINGYSPFFLKPYSEHFCFTHLSATGCPNVIQKIASPIAPMGLSLLDLMRVDEVRISGNARADLFERSFPDWVRAGSSPEGTLFHRIHPYTLPAPIAWVSPGAAVKVDQVSPARIKLSVTQSATTPTSIVLARAWYPGWSARAAGQEIPVHTIAGLATAIDLPAGITGPIEISYWPKGLNLGLLGALAGLVLLGAVTWFKIPGKPNFSERN